MAAKIEQVKYIQANDEAVWDALTNPDRSQTYYLEGGRIESDFTVGAPLSYVRVEGDERQVLVTGEILALEPRRLLRHTFQLAGTQDPPSQVSWDIRPFGRSHVKLTLTHDGFAADSETFQRMKTRYSLLSSRLQTLVEKGLLGWQ